MAKNAPVKKSKRRLKRSVRRSVAAVLMITAIGVAAVPVPENVAAPEVDVEPSPVQYKAADTKSVDEKGDYELNNTSTKHPYVGEDVATSSKIRSDIASGDLVATEKVIRTGGGTYLTWQFLYMPYPSKSSGNSGVLCKYNSTYAVDEVDLGLQPIASYYTITMDDFNNYFTNPERVSATLKDEMDNLNSGNVLYPNADVTYSYSDYNPATGTIKTSVNAAKRNFLLYYYGRSVEEYSGFFQKYYEEGGDSEPEPLTVSPKNLQEPYRTEFFLEHNLILTGSDYKLVLAHDQRLDQNGYEKDGSEIYVAFGGTSSTLDERYGYKDVDGYVVKEDSRSITMIGEEAFKGVGNVGQISISGQVSYIGDSAFEGSGISSLIIGNADMIGNRAFANCTALKTVTFGDNPGTGVIGAEAFRGSGINSKISLPRTIKTIGYGAFSDCADLDEIEFDTENSTDGLLTLKNFAFYNDKQLSKVEFGKSRVDKIGYACFAIQSPSGDVMTDFSFPSSPLNTLDHYVMANRRGLQNVSILNYQKEIWEDTFYNCFGLEKAVFSAESAFATFGEKLFYYVTNPNFCVYGPEFYDSANPALPRQSTWDAVRKDGQGIPYVYERDGKTYHEVALTSEDGTRYRYGAGNDGELISCALISGNGDVDIVIPSQIGTFAIKKIGNTCFTDAELRSRIKSVTIQNNSVSEIAAGTFRDLPKLSKVRIGNSVTNVGASAFAGCKKLEDVYFTTPSAGYSSLTFGSGAFVTTGSKLTFHGDIVKGYAPFDYAADQNNILKDEDDRYAPAINICYQSLWESEVGTHLKVISDKNGNMTLVDYPKISDLSVESIRKDEELRDYCSDMENYYYYTAYDSGSYVEQQRNKYAILWYAKETSLDRVVIDGTEYQQSSYDDELENSYGPWINPNYCGEGSEVGYWRDYVQEAGYLTADSGSNGLVDLLFEPIVAYAVNNPTPYFTKNPYNFMENYNSYLNDPLYSTFPDYKKVPDMVWTFINGTQHIVVPDGVDSIDVAAYAQECEENYDKYVEQGKSNSMYTSFLNGAKPGLFSGYYEDYEGEDPNPNEVNKNGNDYIRSVILTSVKSLPDYAFDSCEQLERVELGAVNKVGILPFRDCPKLINLTGNEKYPAENGILYEKQDGEQEAYKVIECLLARGSAEPIADMTVSQLTDPKIAYVESIAERAFENCDKISMVDLSSATHLTEILDATFKDCDILSYITLPVSVNDIQDDAFAGISTSVPDGFTRFTVEIPGSEVNISDNAFGKGSEYVPPLNKYDKERVKILTYKDTAAYRYAVYYAKEDMQVETYPESGIAYSVIFMDYDGTQLGDIQYVVNDYATEPDTTELEKPSHRPGYRFTGEWLGTNGQDVKKLITQNCIFFAQYESDGTLVNGKCEVVFRDGIDGHQMSGLGANEENGKYYINVGSSFMESGKSAPSYYREGYTFVKWSNDWTENTIINSNMTIIALYTPNTTSGGSTNTSGNSTNTSNGSGNTGNGSNTSSKNSSSTSVTSTSSSSDSTSSTSSGSNSTGVKYTVTVENGSGSGSYEVGSTVVIAANEPAPGMVFQKWTTESDNVTLASVSMTATTFTMPANNVTVTANYIASTGNVSNNGSGNGNNIGNGSTRVDITKPGISNKDLATANVNGSTDNFIVKITETDEATRAVADALTNKYGSLDNILYYAMDISLYDSTGTVKISDTTGITVDITIPIPDALVAYGGNNMAGAVINGNQLENLNENFTTINGVPCIRFTATHFSPYTVYVDTGNLTEGMLDTTPKTGDPIHPKWFLSIGLACLSIILFMKKDKAVKVKTA